MKGDEIINMNNSSRDVDNVVIEVKDLYKWFPLKQSILEYAMKRPKKYVKAVNGVSFKINKGCTVGLVGESGCGKSTIARCIVRLYDLTEGSIFFNNKNFTDISSEQLRLERAKMQMIFQDPYSSLNPRMSVYETIEEMLKFHNVVSKDKIHDRIKDLLEMTGLSMDVADRFPGEFSGGQRQRIGIARSLSSNPEFLIADEPVSALDVSIQAQILNLLVDLKEKFNLTVLFISHDLNVVKHIAERIVVMYLGSIVEMGDTADVFENPYHPYTEVLLNAIPDLNPEKRTLEYVIEGELPSPTDLPKGCKFHPRCSRCQNICKKILKCGRQIACHFPLK